MADERKADPRLQAGVAALLGQPHDGHPPGRELLALVEGTLAPARAEAVRRHLLECALCAGLEGAAREGLNQALSAEQVGDALPLLPLRLAPAGQPRALAASETAEPCPLPEDRQELARHPSGRSAVYFRRQGRAKVGLFSAGEEGAVLLAGAPLEPEARGPDFQIFDLGLVRDLAGQELEIRLDPDLVRRFTLEGG